MSLESQKACEFRGEKLIVKFPNVGQLLDMESMKQSLTSNRYGTMATSGVKSMYFALDLVDAIVFIQVLCPKVKRMLEIDNYTLMSPLAAKELIKFYKEEILPWYSEVSKELYLSIEADVEQPAGKPEQEG